MLIVEVLSPSTHKYDRIKEFAHYKQLESLREYLLVGSEQVHVERLTRVDNGDKWLIEMYDELEDVVTLESVDCEIPLRRMYLKVEFRT
jgi:Uma2 family endonuclease